MKHYKSRKYDSKKVKMEDTRSEDVILTYVNPHNNKGTMAILQCIICSSNGYVKVGADVWRELDMRDTPSFPVKAYKSLAELEKHYNVLYQLKCEKSVKTMKMIYGKEWREKYGLSS